MLCGLCKFNKPIFAIIFTVCCFWRSIDKILTKIFDDCFFVFVKTFHKTPVHFINHLFRGVSHQIHQLVRSGSDCQGPRRESVTCRIWFSIRNFCCIKCRLPCQSLEFFSRECSAVRLCKKPVVFPLADAAFVSWGCFLSFFDLGATPKAVSCPDRVS